MPNEPTTQGTAVTFQAARGVTRSRAPTPQTSDAHRIRVLPGVRSCAQGDLLVGATMLDHSRGWTARSAWATASARHRATTTRRAADEAADRRSPMNSPRTRAPACRAWCPTSPILVALSDRRAATAARSIPTPTSPRRRNGLPRTDFRSPPFPNDTLDPSTADAVAPPGQLRHAALRATPKV